MTEQWSSVVISHYVEAACCGAVVGKDDKGRRWTLGPKPRHRVLGPHKCEVRRD